MLKNKEFKLKELKDKIFRYLRKIDDINDILNNLSNVLYFKFGISASEIVEEYYLKGGSDVYESEFDDESTSE